MRRALTALILVALAALVVTHLHTYSALNAGVFIDLPGGHWLGFEYRPAPGFFWDVS